MPDKMLVVQTWGAGEKTFLGVVGLEREEPCKSLKCLLHMLRVSPT